MLHSFESYCGAKFTSSLFYFIFLSSFLLTRIPAAQWYSPCGLITVWFRIRLFFSSDFSFTTGVSTFWNILLHSLIVIRYWVKGSTFSPPNFGTLVTLSNYHWGCSHRKGLWSSASPTFKFYLYLASLCASADQVILDLIAHLTLKLAATPPDTPLTSQPLKALFLLSDYAVAHMKWIRNESGHLGWICTNKHQGRD